MKKFELEAPMAKAGIATAERFTLEIDQYINSFKTNLLNRQQHHIFMQTIRMYKALTGINLLGEVELFD